MSMNRTPIAGLCSLIGLSLAPQAPLAADLNVVVTSKAVHSLIAGVMQDVGSPTVLIAGNASPHSYAMKPSDARTVNAANVFFRVSEGLEPFTGKLVRSLPAAVMVVSLADAPGIKTLAKRTGAAFEAHDHAGDGPGHGHGHKAKPSKADTDPHVWLDPANAKAIVAEIARVLEAKAPEHAARLQTNAAAVTAKLDALDAELAQALKPVAGKPFIVFHDALQYFEARYGVMAAGSISVTPEAKPSAKRIAALRKKVQSAEAVCIFSEPGMDAKIVAAISEGSKVRTGTLDPEATAIPPGPEAYMQLMRGLAADLGKCLGAMS